MTNRDADKSPLTVLLSNLDLNDKGLQTKKKKGGARLSQN